MKRKAPPAGGKILLRLKAAHEPRSQWNGVLFMYILVDFPSREIGKIKKGFRRLRTATWGSASRLREPFEKGSSENFNYGYGAYFDHEKTSLHGQRGFSLFSDILQEISPER